MLAASRRRRITRGAEMDIPFPWTPVGWFQIGNRDDFPVGSVTPLRYFGQDLVAYRGASGELHVLEAHCPHLGAHLGHGGSVVDDCIVCPNHGWTWGPHGENVAIPCDEPNRSARLRVWTVAEQHDCVFVWHDPDGGAPTWEMPDIFDSFPQFETDPGAYYAPLTMKAERERVHPQLIAENGPDSVHFAYVHRATVTPVALDWKPDGPLWKFVTGWPDVRAADPDVMALRIHSWLFGLGGAISVFEGQTRHRLLFTVTPVDPGASDLRYTVWWPRNDGDPSPTPPPEVKARMDKEYLGTMEQDLEIWRYQQYVTHPALAKQDARPYKALRRWTRQFYADPAAAVDAPVGATR
jgi:phenylpropionate dioxygenase-like ring-hydroxylating dioxygenase large terminal subunit